MRRRRFTLSLSLSLTTSLTLTLSPTPTLSLTPTPTLTLTLTPTLPTAQRVTAAARHATPRLTFDFAHVAPHPDGPADGPQPPPQQPLPPPPPPPPPTAPPPPPSRATIAATFGSLPLVITPQLPTPARSMALTGSSLPPNPAGPMAPAGASLPRRGNVAVALRRTRQVAELRVNPNPNPNPG